MPTPKQTKPTTIPLEAKPVIVEGSPVPFSVKSIIILFLSIANLIIFPIIPGVIALIMSKNAIQEVDKAKGMLKGRELIRVGQVISIISLALQLLGLFIFTIMVVLGLTVGAAALFTAI